MKTFLKIWLGLVILVIVGFAWWFPSQSQVKSCMTTSMYEVDLCPKSKNYVPLGQISKNVQNAIILTEDSGFYTHNGFDEDGIAHCFEKMKEKMRIVCGGSTITQQLAKNMYLSKDKNFFRKGVEALITLQLERSLTKKEILEKYLNIVQFGKNIFGIKKAAQFYFKKAPSQLDPVESAFLAMVLPNPEKYSQSYFRKDLTKFARRRITKIVQNMYKFGRIDEINYQLASARIESFLTPKAPVKEQEEVLSTEDLNEMDEE
jgi:monofunctional glycosyltransferase